MVSNTEIIWAEPLPTGTLAQRAELIALTKALELGKDKKLNIYTDSLLPLLLLMSARLLIRKEAF